MFKLLIAVLFSSFLFQPTVSTYFLAIMADFGKICHSDGLFKVDDTNIDRTNTIKVFGEGGTLMRLPFSVLCKKNVC